jgi:hypothetical protein
MTSLRPSASKSNVLDAVSVEDKSCVLRDHAIIEPTMNVPPM